jgi:hypothetical protein
MPWEKGEATYRDAEGAMNVGVVIDVKIYNV